jgi:hypothetical protein
MTPEEARGLAPGDRVRIGAAFYDGKIRRSVTLIVTRVHISDGECSVEVRDEEGREGSVHGTMFEALERISGEKPAWWENLMYGGLRD